MKKALGYILVFSLFLAGLNAQNAVFQITDQENGNAMVVNNDMFTHFTTNGSTAHHEFEFKNISPVTQTITIRKSEIQINITPLPDTAKAYFCTGATCYQPDVINVSVILAPNEAMVFRAYLDEASVAGQSEVSYKFSSAGQTVIFSLKYNADPVSVKKYAGFNSGVSDVFPNPCYAKSFITVNSAETGANMNLTLLNSLGSIVSSKEVVMVNGKNTINLETENLSTGVYFVRLSNGVSVATRKITIINQ